MISDELAAVKQLIKKLDQDLELAESNRMDGYMCDDHTEATKEFSHGCLRILLAFGAIAVFVLESYVKEKEE